MHAHNPRFATDLHGNVDRGMTRACQRGCVSTVRHPPTPLLAISLGEKVRAFSPSFSNRQTRFGATVLMASVDQRDQTGHVPAALQVPRGEAAPAPLVLQLIEAVLRVGPVAVELGDRTDLGVTQRKWRRIRLSLDQVAAIYTTVRDHAPSAAGIRLMFAARLDRQPSGSAQGNLDDLGPLLANELGRLIHELSAASGTHSPLFLPHFVREQQDLRRQDRLKQGPIRLFHDPLPIGCVAMSMIGKVQTGVITTNGLARTG